MFLRWAVSPAFHQVLLNRRCGHVSRSLHYPLRVLSCILYHFILLLRVTLARLISWYKQHCLNKSTHESRRRIVPADRLNGLINMLLHTTFTLRIFVLPLCCRTTSRRTVLHFHSLSEPFNQHFSTIIFSSKISCFIQQFPRYFRNSPNHLIIYPS